ncbi:MAG: hypothetical protein AAGA48_39480 [Myxococcota bacterium]
MIRPATLRTPRPLAALGLGLLLWSVLACSGASGFFGPKFDNTPACRQFVDTYNHLECVPENQRLGDDVCPDWLDRSGCDLTETYSCLLQSAVCRDGVPHVASRAECGDAACD